MQRPGVCGLDRRWKASCASGRPTFELGGRVRTRTPQFFDQPHSIAGAARYQLKLDQHMVLIFDTVAGFPEDRDTVYGFRSELLLKF